MLAKLFQTLRTTHDQWLKVMGTLCADYGINISERYLLQHLLESEQQTISQIAQHRHVSRQHIQGLIHPLVNKFLLTLYEKPSDKRSVLVALTPEGERVIQVLIKQERQYIEQLTERFLEEDVELSNRTLYALAVLLKASPVMPDEQSVKLGSTE
jgi:DNA-binding MarR family transcriptional regulator